MLKTLTLSKLLNRPFTLLVQIKARNNWYKQNKIRRLLYLLYQNNEITNSLEKI